MDISSEMIHALLPVIPRQRARDERGRRRLARRDGRSDRPGDEGVLGHAQRLARQAQAADGPSATASRRFTKPSVRAGAERRLGLRRSRPRPRGQRHPRRAARRLDRRPRAGRDSRRGAFGLRQNARHRRRIRRAAARDRADGRTADNFRAVFWLATIPAFVSVLVLWLFVREPQGASRATPLRRGRLSRSSARSARASGGSCSSRRCSRSRASARRS
jgi:hypothetical protein